MISYNVIDICVNWKKNVESLGKKSYRIAFYIIIALYAIIFIAFIVLYIIISNMNFFSTIDNALYIENNNEWLKFNNMTINPEGFCFTKAKNDGTLKTEDFAMMTTLPRLYSTTKDGKCYIKPSMRGLFNSTMKYIFGKDYEKEKIQIMCKKLVHNLYLIITSENILNQTLKSFNHTNYKILPKQFDINNSDYFSNFTKENLKGESKNLYEIYERCKSKGDKNNCESERDTFTQYYWPHSFSDKYSNIIGFERYQINIDSNMIIQPSFITKDGHAYSGTHYIIGGGYEDPWNFGFFIETIGRQYIPSIMENLLPFYSLIRGFFINDIIRLDWLNKYIFYTDDFLAKEMKSMSKLYNQFNFSKQSLFLIGHSISGTLFKVISFSSDVQGIAFEASDGETNMNYIHKSHLKKSSDSESQITNVYSKDAITIGNDEKCNVNGILPKRYKFPNVFDTACLTAISCSSTMKYVPFCKQVLTQNKKDPLKEFNISFESYLNHYGFK